MFLQILSDVLGGNATKKKISCYTLKQFQLDIMDSEQVQIKAGVHVKAVSTSLNTAFQPISR